MMWKDENGAHRAKIYLEVGEVDLQLILEKPQQFGPIAAEEKIAQGHTGQP